jgi:CheY-like chemotaxis protein
LAHDIRNQSLVVNWSSRQLVQYFPEDHPARKILAAIDEAGTQTSAIAQQLQELVQPAARRTESAGEFSGNRQPPTDATHELTGTETILLVDDDPQILNLLRTRLERCGYRIFSAGHGSAALALLHHVGSLDLLVTDLQLPEISGQQLADLLRKQFTGLPVLYLSGECGSPVEAAGTNLSESFLPKPFRSRDLLSKIRHVLDRRTDAVAG